MRTLFRATQISIGASPNWIETRDGDPTAAALYARHYSARRYVDGRDPKLIVGPGQKMVLVTGDGLALFVWRKFRSDDLLARGVNCAVFRNEGPRFSSELILEAETIARRRWPLDNFYTYVNPTAICSSNPGYCFICAGWTKTRVTKNGLIVLEKETLIRGGTADP